MLEYFYVMLGGALGTGARFWISDLVATRFGASFPFGTLAINVSGSFAIGFFSTLTDPNGALLVPSRFRSFFTIGLCGGYTTFSSFSLQTLRLAQDREWLYAGLNAGLSVVLCLVAVWLGHAAAAYLNQSKG